MQRYPVDINSLPFPNEGEVRWNTLYILHSLNPIDPIAATTQPLEYLPFYEYIFIKLT
jgi:hypothetical protein